MSSFTTPLVVEFDYESDSKKPFVLVQPFQYLIGSLDSAEWVYVPVGFRTDFASIPRPFRNLFSPTGEWGKPAVLHDFLYGEGYVTQLMEEEESGDIYEEHRDVSRKEADDIFYEAMGVAGVGWFQRNTIYWAVRLGGAKTWNHR